MAVKANAATAAQNWQTGFSGAGAAYEAGIDAVTVSPGQLAANQKNAYVAGVQNNANIWAAKVAAVDLQSWKNAAKTTGSQRLQTGAQKGAPKMQAFMQTFLPDLTNIVNGLPARGDFGANMQRFTQFATQLHANKGKY